MMANMLSLAHGFVGQKVLSFHQNRHMFAKFLEMQTLLCNMYPDLKKRTNPVLDRIAALCFQSPHIIDFGLRLRELTDSNRALPHHSLPVHTPNLFEAECGVSVVRHCHTFHLTRDEIANLIARDAK
jgi:hypothetical protein